MTIEERIEQIKILTREVDTEGQLIIFMWIKKPDSGDTFMGGNTCIRCMLDELMQYVLVNNLKHTEEDHPANIMEEMVKSEKEIKH